MQVMDSGESTTLKEVKRSRWFGRLSLPKHLERFGQGWHRLTASIAAHPRLTEMFSGLVFLAIALFLVRPMFAAQFGAVDDHEIPVIGRQITDHGILETIALRIAEANGRFRPAYWIGRVLETAVWGQFPTGWYFDRVVLLVATMAGTFAVARLWVGPAAALVGAILVVAGPQAEAFTRLGPQEGYAVPLLLGGLAFVGRGRFTVGFALLTTSAFTKEPFLIAPVLGAAWAWRLGDRRWPFVGGAIAIVAGTGALFAVLANGGDYYGQVRNLRTVTRSGIDLAMILLRLTVWPLVLMLPKPAWQIAGAIGLMLFGWQATVLGDIGIRGRYLFPLVIGAGLGSALAASKRPALLLILVLIAGGSLLTARDAARAYARRSVAFAAFVDQLRADPRPLIISVENPSDVELAWAIREYLADRPMVLLAEQPLPGFLPAVSADCLELDVDGPPVGACPEARPVPPP